MLLKTKRSIFPSPQRHVGKSRSLCMCICGFLDKSVFDCSDVPYEGLLMKCGLILGVSPCFL